MTWMTWIFKGNPFDFLDFVDERLYHEVERDIFAAISDKCGDANKVQMIDNRPILQDAREEKLCKYEKQLNVSIKLTEQKQQ